MHTNQKEPTLPEVILTPRQEEEHWEAVLREDAPRSEEELRQAHVLEPLAQKMHDVLVGANLLYSQDNIPEVIANLRRLAVWLEEWNETHVFTCQDGCRPAA